jgi:hypothetical protein
MKPLAAMTIAANCRQVEGWFSLEAAMLFAWIDELQRARGVAGDFFEIGVHRGRSAILLSHLVQPGESLGICDLFGEQTANLSRSGSGDRAKFETNMRRFAAPAATLRVFAKPSSLLSPAEIGDRCRFFHVDGGHNADEALGDLELAAACLVADGVIVVDDPFRGEWPGVTEAIVRFLDARPEFTAVAVGFNKLVLAAGAAADSYARSLEERSTRFEYGLGYPWQVKTLPFLGRPLRIFHMPTRVNPKSLRVRLENLHRSQPWARSAVPAGIIGVARRVLS